MNKKDIIDTVVILLILINLVILAEIKGYKLDKKQVEINALQNKVEQQIELIDALQQQEGR